MDRAALMALAIKERPTACDDEHVAVVGGGFAGLMAASTLLQLGFKVTLFERKRLLVPIQVRCYDRYIHPNSYDWPMNKLEDEYKLAGIKWDAGFADHVSAQTIDCFETIRSNNAIRYFENLETHVDNLRPEVGLAGDVYQLVDDKLFSYGPFTRVIFAVGFGPETHVTFGDKVDGYWENTGIDNVHGTKDRPMRFLISGAGDGSLISIVEAMFEESDHSVLVDLVCEWLSEDILDELRALEISFLDAMRESRPVKILDSYDRIFDGHIDGIKAEVAKAVKEGASLTLNTSAGEIFTPGSSPLNRLLTFILFRCGFISFRPGRLSADKVKEEIGNDGARRYSVELVSGEVRNFDRFVTRYGVNQNFVISSVRGLPDSTIEGLSAYRKLELERSIPEDVFKFLDW